MNGNAAEKGAIDEKAIEVMKNMSNYLSEAKTFSFEAMSLYDHAMKSGIK